MANKHIIFVNLSASWGGGERWHFEHGKHFQNNGWKVHFFTRKKSDLSKRLLAENIPQTSFGLSNLSWLNPFIKRQIKSTIDKLNPSYILLNGSLELKLIAHPTHRRSTKVIYRRGLDRAITNNALNRKLIQQYCNYVLCNSQATLHTICPPAIPEKCHVIYNGIPVQAYNSKSINPNNKLIIGNAGRLVPQKNQSELLSLAKVLISNNIEFEMRIAGDGPLKSELNKAINENKLNKHVKLLGFIDNMPDFYQNIDVFVLTSNFEGFGFVLAEAMMHGIPAIAKSVSSNPELIVHNKNGFLYNEIKDVYNYLIALKSEKTYEEMSTAAIDRVRTKFNFTTNAESLERWLLHLD